MARRIKNTQMKRLNGKMMIERLGNITRALGQMCWTWRSSYWWITWSIRWLKAYNKDYSHQNGTTLGQSIRYSFLLFSIHILTPSIKHVVIMLICITLFCKEAKLFNLIVFIFIWCLLPEESNNYNRVLPFCRASEYFLWFYGL